MSVIAFIILIDEPVVTNKDKPTSELTFNYNLTVRRPARLNFTTIGTPTPTLTLLKKTQPGNIVQYEEVASERFTVTLIGITISSVEPKDEGEYRLTATYSTFHDSEDFSITVNSKYSSLVTCMDSVFTHTYLLCVCNYYVVHE